jgi:voltage-gated potassium channel
MRADSLQQRCPTCEKLSHEPNAAFCSRCGTHLFKRSEPEPDDEQDPPKQHSD